VVLITEAFHQAAKAEEGVRTLDALVGRELDAKQRGHLVDDHQPDVPLGIV